MHKNTTFCIEVGAIVELTYLDYLFLDIFSMKEPRKTNSLYHILSGKRTVSVMLQAIRYQLAPYYGLLGKLKRDSFENKLNYFEQVGLLTSTTDGLLLTQTGQNLCQDFFRDHTRIIESGQMRHALILPQFKSRFLFLIQVSSESAHKNNHYVPLQLRLTEQSWLKSYIKEQQLEKDVLAKKLGHELLRLLEEVEGLQEGLFVCQFEGNKITRKTANQLSLLTGLEETEILMAWHQDWLRLMDVISLKEYSFPLLSHIYQQLSLEGRLCPPSTRDTYVLWMAGHPLDRIAYMRDLKASTINDHLSEIAILYRHFPFDKILTAEMMTFVAQANSEGLALDHQAIQSHFPKISFFENRLMQIMNGGGLVWKN